MRRSGIDFASASNHTATLRPKGRAKTAGLIGLTVCLLGGVALGGALYMQPRAVVEAQGLDRATFEASVATVAQLQSIQQPTAENRIATDVTRAAATPLDLTTQAQGVAPENTSNDKCESDLLKQAAAATVFFDVGVVGIPEPEKLEKGQALIEQAKDCPFTRIELRGHSDSTGPQDVNDQLSWQRVNSVRKGLEALGVNTTDVVFTGMGAKLAKTSATTTNIEEHARDRRVEFLIVRTLETQSPTGEQ
ncbi:OmpA family protein [Nereida sp. MMG025]|uniref:OmpA family protein n=1 Tax=Nereida sp. MMG025 TaxID=2909981 RepID=UPI001F4276FF|nr:OmpA family protein [Nereida sp. MMG025]MCF6444326.1 OmpA family protein [Nereida sp. MMG025]